MLEKKNKTKGMIVGFTLAAIAILFWSVHSIAIRYMINDLGMSSMALLFIRYFTGTLFLVILILFIVKKKEIKEIFKEKNNILKNKNFWFTSLSIFATSLFLHLSLKYTSASIGMILLTMSPTLVVLYTMRFFQYKLKTYISIRKIFFTVLITSIGSALLINDYSFIETKPGNYKYLGDFLAALAAISGALFDIYIVELRKDYKKTNGLIITSMYLLVGTIISLPIGFIFIDTIFPLNTLKILLILLIGFGATGLAYFIRFLAARYLNAIILSIISNILGVTTVIAEFVIYGGRAPLTLNLIIGGLMILFSTVYITYLTNKK